MAYVITSLCVGVCDMKCVDACPVECISGPSNLKRGGAAQLFIDPDGCIDCNACRPVCPAEAIYPDHELPVEHLADSQRNAAFFRRQAG